MRVSTQFPIAVHSLLMIVSFPDIKITSDMVAESAGCNAVIIRNIFTKLKRAGLLDVKAGRGDTALAKPAKEISLWDIYTAVETDKTDDIFKFHSNMSGSCPVGCNIRSLLRGHFEDAVDAMKEELSSVTLETIRKELQEKVDEKKAP
ncbi:MAG: Rrf2 family transcriptional regulator [Lacrimispora sp.]